MGVNKYQLRAKRALYKKVIEEYQHKYTFCDIDNRLFGKLNNFMISCSNMSSKHMDFIIDYMYIRNFITGIFKYKLPKKYFYSK